MVLTVSCFKPWYVKLTGIPFLILPYNKVSSFMCHYKCSPPHQRVTGLVNNWPPLWSSGQSSWLQIQRSWFGSRRYQILWEVVGLERGPLNLVSTTGQLLEWKNSGSGLESREYDRRGYTALCCLVHTLLAFLLYLPRLPARAFIKLFLITN
jgi:hypothetical protein